MKKILFIIFALFAFTVRADNTITAKSYVDAQAAGLQEQISANDANTVLTYTDTAGTVGEKQIYDASAAYAGQNDALVTAGAFNTAIQNALETEFVCIDWLGDVHDNAHCLLYQIRTPYHKSRNMFNKNTTKDGYMIRLDHNGQANTTNSSCAVTDYILVEPGKTYTITNVRPGDGFSNGVFYYDANKVYSRGHGCNGLKCWATPQDGEVYIRFNLLISQKDVVQMEEGTVATPYVPYGNIYLPQN